jgi:hypothetical protein
VLEDAKLLDEEYDDDAGRRAWGTSITVDGVSYATSLFWQPLQNSSDYMQEVESASGSILEGADLFCIKGGKAPQFGICVSHEGYKSGQMVAAVALATALSNISSFVAVFKTNEGWWYTCVRNDIILSDGDMLFLSEEEARGQFMSMLAVPDWGKKIAPREWNIEDTEEVDVFDLLQQGSKVKLQKIRGLRGSKLFLVVAISVAIGVWLVSSLVDKVFLAPPKRPVVVPVRPKVIQPVAEEVKPLPKPWETLKNPTQFMENCYAGITSLMNIMPPGWKIDVINCSDSVVATSWHQEIGFLSVAEDAFKKAGLQPTDYSFDLSGTGVQVSIPMKAVGALMSPPEKSMVDLRNTLNNEFQMLGIDIALSEETVNQDVAPQGRGPQGFVAPLSYGLIHFSFTSDYNPLMWIKMLTKYSGLEIRMITYTPSSSAWFYEGAIYVL